MGSFASEYQTLKKKREEGEKKVTKKKTAAKTSPTVGTGFASQYMALRETREKEGQLQGLSLPALPTASKRAGGDVRTRRAQLMDEAAVRHKAKEGGVKGLTLPALPDASAGDLAAGTDSRQYRGPEWAQQIADRYKPENNQDIRENPVAAAEKKKWKAAEKGVDWRGIPMSQSPDGVRSQGQEKPTAEDWGELAKQTALAGVGQMSRAAGATLSMAEQAVTRPLGWLLENPDLYKEGVLYNINQNAAREADKVQQNLTQAAEKTGKAGALIAQFGPATIAALPQAALAYLTAGQSLAAQTSTAGLQAASTAAQLTGGAAVANTAMEAVKSMAANPSFQYSFLNTVGGEYEQALEDGADAKTAYAYATLTALMNSVVEIGGEGGIDQLPEGNKPLLLEWVKDMFDEGKEEVIQGAISQMIQNAVYQKGNPLFSMMDEDAIINPGRMAEDFAGGAVVGGILGGGQLALQSAVNRSAQRGNTAPVQLREAELAALSQPQAGPREGLVLPTAEDVPSSAETGREGRSAPAQGTSQPETQTGQEAAKNGLELPKVESGQNNTATAGAEAGEKTAREQPVVSETFGENIMRQMMENRGGFRQAVFDGQSAKPAGGGFTSAEGRDITKADSRLLENLGKITKSDIRVISQAELDRIAGQSGADGMQMGDQLYISETAERPMVEVAKHELTHRLQDVAPEEYGAFRDYVAEIYRADGTLEQYIEGMIQGRKNAGITLTQDQALDEIAADYAGELMVDERAVRRLAGENRGLLEKMLDGLREIIENIRRKLGGGRNAQTEELEKAAKLWQDALEAAGRSAEDAGNGQTEARFSFGGKNAIEADSGSLARAEVLERKGAAAEEIRQKTGWFRSMDGLWRFEIDDSGMEYSQWGDMRRSDRAEYARFRELERKFIEDTLTAEEQAELRGLLDGGHGAGRAAERGTLRLADYIKHDELFRNYPQLKGATLRFVEMEERARGGYSPSTNTITISEKLRGAPEDVILHEVQHAIQAAEGFAGGSSPEYWENRREEIEDGIIGARENLRLWLKDIGYSEYVRKSMDEVTSGKKTMEQHWEDLRDFKDRSAHGQQIRKCEEELRSYQEQYESISNGMTSWELYRNTAGEIEARDAARRRTMTAQERRQTAPDLGDGNTVFTDGGAEGASIGYDQDNRPFVTVEEDILEGVPREDWVRTVKDNLRKKFPNGVTVGNSEIEINAQSRNEMTYSRYTRRLMETEPELYADKLRAVGDADEILRATTDYVNEALIHPRKDSIQDFARGSVQFRVGGNDYTAQVVVAMRSNGKMLLYDILNLKPTAIQSKKPDTVIAKNPSPGTDRNAVSNFTTTISQTGQEVKAGMPSFSEEVMRQLPGTAADTQILDKKAPGAEYTANAQNEPRSRGPAPDGVTVSQREEEVKSLRGLQLMDDRDYRQAGTWRAENSEQPEGLRLPELPTMLETDSEGRELTKAQQEYFKDSQVRDENGRLMPVYHGTDADFWTFQSEDGVYWFSQSEDYAESMMEERDGDRMIEAYLNIKNPYRASLKPGEFTDPAAEAPLIRKAKAEGYDGVILTADTDNPLLADNFYAAFSQEQIKTTDNQKPTENPDIRYSVKGDADLKKEMDRLRRQNQRLKEQMQRTDRAEMNRESVQRQARDILKEYGSRYDKQELYSRMEALYNGIANQTLSENEMRTEARSIAEDILSENREQTNGLYEEYQQLRKELRTRGISIAPEYRTDLESAGGYEGLRKQYFGKLRLGNNGTAVDRIYDDLAGRYPELFPDDILHPADQLVRITEVLDRLQPVMGNAYEGGMDQAAEYLAGELLERYFDTPEKAPTFADKQARKMEEQRARDREQMLAAVAKERSKRETALQQLRDQYQAANRKRIENQNASQRRETIRRHADRLGRMLLRPTDKQHVPEALRGAALELVRQIDTGSNYFLDPDTGKRIYTSGGTQIDMESQAQIQTRRTEAARELQAQYEKLAAEGGYTVDPDIAEYLDEVANMGNKALGDMSKAELDTVWKVMRVIEHSITKSNELLGRSRYATVSEMAEKLREQNGSRKDRRNLAGLAGTADQLLNMDMLTPETYFHKLGEAGEEIFRQMRSAADRQTTILKEGVDQAQELVEKSGVDLRKAEKDMHTFTTSGGELTLSTAQIMELYALSKREQALEHIYVGGLKPKGARTGRLGLVEAGGAAPVKVTVSDVAEIIGTLTAEQRQLADGLQKYLSGDLSRHGNDASMTVYGYEKFKERNYWPIKVDQNQTKTDVKKEAESKTVAGYGMTKAVKPNARNAVVLRGVLDSYTEHLNQMATYSGWLAASEDVNRVHNYQFTDENGGADGTVKTLLEQVYGKGGNSYWDRLMSDVAMGTKAGAEPSLMDQGLNQFKAAKVGGNLRVILQQPTAIIRAANMIAPKYFLTAKNPMKGWESAKKYSPIAQWKDWGYFELDTGRSLKELIAGEGSGLESVKNKLMEPAGMADSVAWGHLWNAVEAETAEKRPELRRGSENFYKAAAERFGEVIDRTQVVDSVLHRTQIMRSANSLTRMSTSFMSEPSKIYNMVYRDLYDVQSAGSAAKRAKAGKALARSTAALVVSFAVNAVAQSLPDMWRNDDRGKELEEKFTDAYVGNFVENFDPIGYVPFLKDFESIIQGYSVDRSDLEGFSDVVNALGQMGKAWTGESKKSEAAAALELACKAGDMLGLPMTNVKRDAVGIIQTGLQGLGKVEAQYVLDKLGMNPDKASATFYDDLYRAMGTDWGQYENIYQDMIQRGWDEEKLADNMEKRMAKEAGLEKTSSLPVGYSALGENLTFDQEIMRQLTGGGSWMDTLPKGSLELARDLEQLEPEEGAESVTKMQKIRELRDSIWGDEVKDLALSNILGDADYGRLQAARKAGISIEKWCDLYDTIAKEKIKRTGKSGSPSQEDVANALKGSGLTERQKDVIWAGYGWKGER